MCVPNTPTGRVSVVSRDTSSWPSPSPPPARSRTSACWNPSLAIFSIVRRAAQQLAGASRRVPKTAPRSPERPSRPFTSACKENAEMPRFLLLLLLLLSLLFAASVQAAQVVNPAVFMALERAQSAQQKGDYATARKVLQQ